MTITLKTINAIIFLKSHPFGPKYSSIEIANYLRIPVTAVMICVENVMPSDIIGIDGNTKSTESDPAVVFEPVIRLMQSEVDKTNIDQTKLSDNFSKITTNGAINQNAGKIEEDMIEIKFDRWIEYCKHGWYEKLDEVLGIQKKEVTIKEFIDDLYSVQNFSDSAHEAMLGAIDRELRFKKKVEPLQVGVQACIDIKQFINYPYKITGPVDSKNYYSYYSKNVTMENLRIFIEDILNENQPIDSKFQNEKTIKVPRTKYIKICENEWYGLALDNLDIPSEALQSLEILINNLYSAETFTDEKHKQMLDAISREYRFRDATENLVMYETINGLQYSYYSPMVSVKNFELVLEDILEVECPTKYDDIY